MELLPTTRAKARAFLVAGSVGIILGSALGAAYMGSELAHQIRIGDQAKRLRLIANTQFDKGHFLNLSSLKPVGSASKTMLLTDTKSSNVPSATSEAATDDQNGDLKIDQSAMAIATRFDPSRAPNAYAHDRQSITTAQNLLVLRERNLGRHLTLKSDDADRLPRLKPITLQAAPYIASEAAKSDLDCLTQAVYYEARGEGEAGMRAVAQVILNRVRHPAFPKSICGVVYQGGYRRTGCQFSFACNGAMGGRVENWAWKRSRNVAESALSGFVMRAVGTATHFHTTSVQPDWAGRLNRIATIGTHIFYQFHGRGARLPAQIPSPDRSKDESVILAQPQTASSEALETSDVVTPVAPEAPSTPSTSEAPMIKTAYSTEQGHHEPSTAKSLNGFTANP